MENNSKDLSQAIVVHVKNNSSTTQSARVFFPNEKNADNYGNVADITIEAACAEIQLPDSTLPTPKYDDILSALDKRIINIGKTYIHAVVNAEQPFTSFIVYADDVVLNKFYGWRIKPALDPFQTQNTISVDNTPYELNNIDGYSGLIFKVLPNASFYVYLFPSSI